MPPATPRSDLFLNQCSEPLDSFSMVRVFLHVRVNEEDLRGGEGRGGEEGREVVYSPTLQLLALSHNYVRTVDEVKPKYSWYKLCSFANDSNKSTFS